MKGKLTLAAVAVAFAMMSVPTTASAGHFGRYDWCKRDCFWGWMHRDRCAKKVVVYKKKHHVVKKAKKKPAK
jgi:hypothetical protein